LAGFVLDACVLTILLDLVGLDVCVETRVTWTVVLMFLVGHEDHDAEGGMKMARALPHNHDLQGCTASLVASSMSRVG
jgi:hypothetical protein